LVRRFLFNHFAQGPFVRLEDSVGTPAALLVDKLHQAGLLDRLFDADIFGSEVGGAALFGGGKGFRKYVILDLGACEGSCHIDIGNGWEFTL
jgi:hypothetical protein